MAEADEDVVAPPLVLDVTVQSSRFHELAATSINLKGITIAVGGESDDAVDGAPATARRELISDADLSLSAGTRYALVARNGTGKSIFLKVLASGALFDPDTQLSLRVQLVSQSFAPPPSDDWTVREELEVPPFGWDLTDALDAGKRIQRRTALRSGKRGKLAREKAVAMASSSSAAGGAGASAGDAAGAADAAADEADADKDGEESGTGSEDSSGSGSGDDADAGAGAGRARGGHDAAAAAAAAEAAHLAWSADPPSMPEIAAAFKTLRIPIAMLDRPYASLSGGWRMRVVLAKALLYKPNVLLLDEPTNHLDIAGINHLIQVLQGPSFEGATILFVSHDLHFVNELAEGVVQLQGGRFHVAAGNWDTLTRERADRKKFTDRYAGEREKEQARLLSSIEASMRKAGKDDKLRKQLAGRREKALERGVGMMRNSKGHRFRKNDDENAGFHLTLLDDVEVLHEEKPVKFAFLEPSLARSAGGAAAAAGGAGGGAAAGAGATGAGGVAAAGAGATLLSIDGLAFSYGGAAGLPAAAEAAPIYAPKIPVYIGAGKKKKGPAPAAGGAAGKGKGSAGSASAAAEEGAEPEAFSLDLPDLNVCLGERVVLLGPNGHGKSTLLRLAVGELRPTRGAIKLAPSHAYFDQHSVGHLGTEPRPALQYAVETRKGAGLSSGSEEEENVKKVLGSFGLGPHLGTPVALLSGGQRVALVIALIALRRPALLVLDEPSAHLDLQAREGLATALATFAGSVLLVSHDIGFIELLRPTRALLCNKGRFRELPEDTWRTAALAL